MVDIPNKQESKASLALTILVLTDGILVLFIYLFSNDFGSVSLPFFGTACCAVLINHTPGCGFPGANIWAIADFRSTGQKIAHT